MLCSPKIPHFSLHNPVGKEQRWSVQIAWLPLLDEGGVSPLWALRWKGRTVQMWELSQLPTLSSATDTEDAVFPTRLQQLSATWSSNPPSSSPSQNSYYAPALIWSCLDLVYSLTLYNSGSFAQPPLWSWPVSMLDFLLISYSYRNILLIRGL